MGLKPPFAGQAYHGVDIAACTVFCWLAAAGGKEAGRTSAFGLSLSGADWPLSAGSTVPATHTPNEQMVKQTKAAHIAAPVRRSRSMQLACRSTLAV